MGSKVNALLNVAGLCLVLVVNALANILPINGYNTGQVSGFYPNFFVPAGFTFGIWGIIYLLLIGFVFCSLFAAFGKFNEAAKKAIHSAGPYFLVTCLLNAGWILAWHYLYLGLSVLIMFAFLLVLVLLFLSIHLLFGFSFFVLQRDVQFSYLLSQDFQYSNFCSSFLYQANLYLIHELTF